MTRINYISNPPDLVKTDLKTFDTVADQTLYLDELQSNHKLEEFVSRFLTTTSQEILDYYNGKMAHATKMLVRDCLVEVLADAKTADKVLLQQLGLTLADVPRLELMLRNDFVLDGFSASFTDTTSYTDSYYTYDSRQVEDDGVFGYHSTYSKQVLKFDLGTKWRYEHTLGQNHKWIIATWLGLDVGDEIQHKKQNKTKSWDGAVYEEEAYDDEQSPVFFKIAPGMTFSQADDLFAVSLGAWEKYYFAPMPDATAEDYGVWLDLSGRKLFGLPLSFAAEGQWQHTKYSKPRETDDNQQDTRTPTLTATSTYQLNDRFGIVGDYAFAFTDAIYATSTDQQKQHNYDVLAQITFSDEHVLKIGGEGESLTSVYAYDTDDDDDYESFATAEQEWGGTAAYEGNFFDDQLTLKPTIKAGYNLSDGSLVGAYPDAKLSLETDINLEHLEFALSGSVYHKDWTMVYRHVEGETSIPEGEKSGTSTDVSTSASVTWKPTDAFSLTPSYAYSFQSESGFATELYPTHDASLSASLLALQVPIKLWVTAYASAQFYNQAYAREYTSFMEGGYYYGSLSLSTNRFQVAR